MPGWRDRTRQGIGRANPKNRPPVLSSGLGCPKVDRVCGGDPLECAGKVVEGVGTCDKRRNRKGHLDRQINYLLKNKEWHQTYLVFCNLSIIANSFQYPLPHDAPACPG